jgi:hypothetical protein
VRAWPIVLLLLLPSPAHADDYRDLLAGIDGKRAALDARFERAKGAKARAAVLGSARTLAFESIAGEIIPAWLGTSWDFYGTTETPREGTIACGYLVTTVLRDAGFRIERVRLAQQPSERIVKTFAPESKILRFHDAEPRAVVDEVSSKEGDGLYVIGFDYHVGLLVIESGAGRLCHAAWYGPATCEPAADSPGMVSRYHVVGPVLTDERVEDWLEGNAIRLP